MKNLYDIPGYPGYAITRYGRVFKYVTNPRMKNFPIRELRVFVSHYGYKRVAVGRQESVHVLLALTFIGPKPTPRHMVRHLNGNRLDNRIANLAWGTYQDNSNDAVRHGTSLRGTSNKKAKLNDDDVRAIRNQLRNGEMHVSVAAQYGVSKASISHIATKRTWRHVA